MGEVSEITISLNPRLMGEGLGLSQDVLTRVENRTYKIALDLSSSSATQHLFTNARHVAFGPSDMKSRPTLNIRIGDNRLSFLLDSESLIRIDDIATKNGIIPLSSLGSRQGYEHADSEIIPKAIAKAMAEHPELKEQMRRIRASIAP